MLTIGMYRKTYLGHLVLGRQYHAQHHCASEQILNLEGVLTRVMRRLVVDEHHVDDVRLAGNEDELEEGVPEVLCRVGPEKICTPYLTQPSSHPIRSFSWLLLA